MRVFGFVLRLRRGGKPEDRPDRLERKCDASRSAIPVAPPLLTRIKRAYLEQGRPQDKQLVCPPCAEPLRTAGHGWVAINARKAWEKAGLTPIALQESRHTVATWLDAAGVPPKIASVLMGHATPERVKPARRRSRGRGTPTPYAKT
jgi:integrase